MCKLNEKSKMTCQFCGEVLFTTPSGIHNHEKYCEKNPIKPKHYCCKKHSKAKKWKCHYCNEAFGTRAEMYAHVHSHEEYIQQSKTKSFGSASKIWRELHKSEYAKMLEKQRKTVQEKCAAGLIKGHRQSLESRKKLSISRIAYLESHTGFCKWYTVNGVKVQGTWEKRFAEYLSSAGIIWNRDKKFLFRKTHHYTPDFYCPEQDVYFEVKGFRRDRDIYKMYLVLDEHPDLHIKMIEKRELDSLSKISIFNLPDFQEKYERPEAEYDYWRE